MTKQDDILIQSAVKSQHQTIMEGGKIEEFAEALGRFCQVEGWKKLKDEEALPFRSLRHYIEARPPFGAGYPGKEGMDKIEAYLSLKPRIKDFFQHCHANCIFEMAKEEGVSPNVVSKREWNDVIGAKLARDISEDSDKAYKEKAMAYIEGKARVKREPKVNSNSSKRVSFRTNYPYAFASKLKVILSKNEYEMIAKALINENLEEMVEFENKFHIAINAFENTKKENGWSAANIRAPKEVLERVPNFELSNYINGSEDGKKQILLSDKDGEIATVRLNSSGNGVNAISFDLK